MAKNADFSKISKFYKKKATLLSSPYGCQVREKSLEWFLRKAETDGETHKTDSIGPSGFQPGTKNLTSRFHMMFGSRDTNLRPFLAKVRIFLVQISAGPTFLQPNQWL